MSTCRHVVPPRDPDVGLGPLLLGPRLRPPQHQQVSTAFILQRQYIVKIVLFFLWQNILLGKILTHVRRKENCLRELDIIPNLIPDVFPSNPNSIPIPWMYCF